MTYVQINTISVNIDLEISSEHKYDEKKAIFEHLNILSIFQK